jgi:hypothetical protein
VHTHENKLNKKSSLLKPMQTDAVGKILKINAQILPNPHLKIFAKYIYLPAND